MMGFNAEPPDSKRHHVVMISSGGPLVLKAVQQSGQETADPASSSFLQDV